MADEETTEETTEETESPKKARRAKKTKFEGPIKTWGDWWRAVRD